MARYKLSALIIGLLLCGSTATAEEMVFQGPWHTTNRKLDGIMTCVVTSLGNEQWQGRFHGIWQGVDFDYTVRFEGPPTQLHGTATIDDADYVWSGSIAPDSSKGVREFKATFGGNRYSGHFELKEQDPKTLSR